jgi:hypothetical protein
MMNTTRKPEYLIKSDGTRFGTSVVHQPTGDTLPVLAVDYSVSLDRTKITLELPIEEVQFEARPEYMRMEDQDEHNPPPD